MFVGGVDAYYKALIISFSLEHEHAFTRLGAEKAQVAVTKRGVISSQSYRIAVKLQQLCVPAMPGHGAPVVKFFRALDAQLVAVEDARHTHKAKHKEHSELQPPLVASAQA